MFNFQKLLGSFLLLLCMMSVQLVSKSYSRKKSGGVLLKDDILNVEKKINLVELQLNKIQEYLVENQMSLTFHDSIKDIDWLISKNFSLQGYAANYSFMYVLLKVLVELRPKNILEFGLGQTSKLLAQYVASEKHNAYLNIVEHNSTWLNFFSPKLKESSRLEFSLLELENIKIQDERKNIYSTTRYKGLADVVSNKKYDFVVVDGPNGTPHHSRSQLVEILEHNLAKDFVIVMDDYGRVGEKETINRVCSTLKKLGIEFAKWTVKGNKEQCIVSSTNYGFLRTL